MGAGSLKRLRVRLRATDRESLAETFGSNVFERGVFLKSSQLLALGTPVLLELIYQSGELALRGRGTVESVSSGDLRGMNLGLEWGAESLELVRWLIGIRAAPDDSSDPFECVTVYAGEEPSEHDPSERSAQRAEGAKASPERDPGKRSAQRAERAKTGAKASPERDPGKRSAQRAERAKTGAKASPERDPGTVDFDSTLLDSAEQPTIPGIPVPVPLRPTPPPPPVLPPELVGQRPGSKDAWDLISDLIESTPAPRAKDKPKEAPKEKPRPRTDPAELMAAMADAFEEVSSLDSWADAVDSKETSAREPGEVTPLARIELVRSPVSEPIRTGDIQPLGLDEDSGPIPLPRSEAHLAKPSQRIMAVDFGTVNTRAAVPVKDRPPRIIESRRGTDATPSVVMIRHSGKTIIGEPALRKLPSHPSEGILDARRLLGLPFSSERVRLQASQLSFALVPGEDGEAAVRVGPYDISLEEIVALLLKEARECALMALEERVNRAVLTCPGHFGFRQREALCMAAKLGGLYVERLVSEPLAVAVNAMHETPTGGRVFVYRLGGGTFDAAVIEVDGDHYQMLSCESDLLLGGVDFDAAAATVIVAEVQRLSGIDSSRDPSAMAVMMEAARKAKQMLSVRDRAVVFVDAPATADSSLQIEVEVSRAQMEPVWEPLLSRTVEIAQRALIAAGLDASDVDHVVIAGGQVRAPMVRDRVRSMFQKELIDLDPERAAVQGAALIAERLGSSRELKLRDLLSLTLFAGEFEAPFSAAIPRGTPLPATARYSVRSSFARKTELMLCEGVSEQSVDAIGVLRLEPFTGTAELRFEVSSEGLLSVSAVEGGSRRPLRAELVTDLSSAAPDRSTNGHSSLEK